MGLIQAAVVGVLIFTNKVFRNKANNHFAWFLFLICIVGLDSVLSQYYERLNHFWSLFFDIVGDDIPWIMMLYLPLFRFFTEISDDPFLAKIPYRPLFIPFFCFLLINGVIDLDLDFNLISSPFFTGNRTIFYLLEDYLSIALFSLLHITVFFRFINSTQSKWLKRLWWYTTLLIFIWSIIVLDHTFFDDVFSDDLETILWSIIAVFIYWLIYSGLFQFNLANNRSEIQDRLLSQKDLIKKKGLPVKSKAYFEELMDLMTVDKAYRNPDLGREAVAENLGISVSYLTQLIKENTDKNLAGFVNEFRVEEVKKMLKDPSFDTFDHLSIGLEAGFKSKSAYYTTFKSLTGITPAQFKKLS